MLGDALAAAHAAPAERRIVFWAEADVGRESFELADDFETRLQQGVDLGARLQNAFAGLIHERDDRALMIGADCPVLGAAEIRSAFEALGSCDLVLGPTGDGGYYLVGLRRAVPELFRDIAWSTERVREQTLERAGKTGLTVTELVPLDDVDTAGDLIRLISIAIAEPGRCGPHTLETLRQIGLLPTLSS